MKAPKHLNIINYISSKTAKNFYNSLIEIKINDNKIYQLDAIKLLKEEFK